MPLQNIIFNEVLLSLFTLIKLFNESATVAISPLSYFLKVLNFNIFSILI